jgi:hypothetical protein
MTGNEMIAFPDTPALSKALSSLIGAPGHVISREPFAGSSTFPVEIVTWRPENGSTLRLFAKYLGGKGPNNFGHRGGLQYEAGVYAKVLAKTSLPTITCYGSHVFPDLGETLMLLDYIGEDLQFSKSDDPEALAKAAAWIGAFHAAHEGRAPGSITVYSKDYYTAWAVRFEDSSRDLRREFSWLDDLHGYFLRHIDLLTDAPQTVIHGEYYPKNVLMKDGLIYPVDWESAAVGPGEIDLASLTEGWDEAPLAAAREAYKKARWPSGDFSAEAFEARLLMARIYFYLWWWPDSLDEAAWRDDSYEFNRALQLAKEAGVFGAVLKK